MSDAARQRHIPTITVVCTVIGILAGAFVGTWHSSAWITGLSDGLGALDRRVTTLEAGRTIADQQLAQTAANIAGLQAQMSAVQGSLNDLKTSLEGIRSDIGQMARTANTPLPRR